MRFDIITIFPNFFDSFLNEAIFSRALKPAPAGRGLASGRKKPLLTVKIHNLRKWTNDRHQTVDGRPFGGGVGMVLKLEPIYKAVKAIEKGYRLQVTGEKTKKKLALNLEPDTCNLKTRIILFSPRGKKFNQETAKKWAKADQLIFICGRYEGVDERVAEHIADEVVSIGDFVLSGGEVPAMIVMETISRLIPGVIGKEESAQKSDHAQYTRPEVLEIKEKSFNKLRTRKLAVPKVLLSGDHKKIKEWREKYSKLTKK